MCVDPRAGHVGREGRRQEPSPGTYRPFIPSFILSSRPPPSEFSLWHFYCCTSFPLFRIFLWKRWFICWCSSTPPPFEQVWILFLMWRMCIQFIYFMRNGFNEKGWNSISQMSFKDMVYENTFDAPLPQVSYQSTQYNYNNGLRYNYDGLLFQVVLYTFVCILFVHLFTFIFILWDLLTVIAIHIFCIFLSPEPLSLP